MNLAAEPGRYAAPMAEASDPQPSLTRVHAVDWGRVTPVVHLFQCFRVAMQPSKLAVSWVAVMAVWLVAKLLLSGGKPHPSRWDLATMSPELRRQMEEGTVVRALEASRFNAGTWLLASVGGLPVWLVSALLLLAATVVGLAVCRMAAARLCVGENIGPLAALGFVARKGPWAMLAPVVPGVVIVGVGLALTLLGFLLFSLPWTDVVGGLLFGPMLLAGLGAAVVVAALLLELPADGRRGRGRGHRRLRHDESVLRVPDGEAVGVPLLRAGRRWCTGRSASRSCGCWWRGRSGSCTTSSSSERSGQPSRIYMAQAHADGWVNPGEAPVSTAITGWLDLVLARLRCGRCRWPSPSASPAPPRR